MLNLPNGCSCSEPTIYPSNWKTGGKVLLEKPWYIQYWFRDPSQTLEWQNKHPYGKLIRIKFKGGLTTLEDLRASAKELLQNEKAMLTVDGYNPITKTNNLPSAVASDIPPSTPFIEALRFAENTIKLGKGSKQDLKSVLKYVESAARALRIDRIQIDQVKRKHIKLLLESLSQTKKIWTAHTYNWYRANLNILFNELIEYEAIESNPVWKVTKMKEVTRIRETLSRAQRHQVDMHLRKKKLASFRLFIRIFFHTGIRSTEMLSLKGSDVHLTDQTVRVTIKKGRQGIEVLKTIKDISIRYWKLALQECGPNDYIFSKNLRPGPVPITSPQITRRWETHVKDDLGITADFYSFKHGNTTEMVDMLGEATAAALNSHSGTGMVRKIYDTKRISREHLKIRGADNQF